MQICIAKGKLEAFARLDAERVEKDVEKLEETRDRLEEELSKKAKLHYQPPNHNAKIGSKNNGI